MAGGTSLKPHDYMWMTLVPILLACFIPELKVRQFNSSILSNNAYDSEQSR